MAPVVLTRESVDGSPLVNSQEFPMNTTSADDPRLSLRVEETEPSLWSQSFWYASFLSAIHSSTVFGLELLKIRFLRAARLLFPNTGPAFGTQSCLSISGRPASSEPLPDYSSLKELLEDSCFEPSSENPSSQDLFSAFWNPDGLMLLGFEGPPAQKSRFSRSRNVDASFPAQETNTLRPLEECKVTASSVFAALRL